MVTRSLQNWAKRRRYAKAIAAYRRDGNQPLKLAHAIRHLGDVYYETGQATLAEQYFLESLTLYRQHEHGPSLDFANAIRRLAILREDSGEIDEAIKLWQETHDRYSEVNEPMGIAESASHLALLTRGRGDLDQAREWLNKASAAAEASGHPPSLRYVAKVKTLMEE